MQNATAVVCPDGYTDDEPVPYQLTDKARAALRGEQAEAREMIDGLVRVLRNTGRYNVSALWRRCVADGVTISQRQLIRWFHGQSTPYTTTPVELVARAAGVDRAYLGGWNR